MDLVVNGLDGVRRNGPGWMAKCPSHPDRKPSLSVTEADDGRVLLKCFAECSALDIVQSLGLTLADLFVRTTTTHMSQSDRAELKRRLADTHRAVAIDGVSFELELVLAASDTLRAGIPLYDSAHDRLASACERIAMAREVFRVR
ncbi:hypothetical protein [Pseudoxanthomonas indica]|uniref:hypothetical protein n=1 Tax=Pseudoxanthomonas indica TaxID=428993 RepID=UPI001590096D|nr:hypothetical protein [Pseudoxanthomonas indica]GGD58643.1 hypothetical protein GCM10007235_33690 [Pseudoxanthomonas indica]